VLARPRLQAVACVAALLLAARAGASPGARGAPSRAASAPSASAPSSASPAASTERPGARLEALLDQVKAALAPRCSPACGQVTLTIMPGLRNAVALPDRATRRSRLGYDPVLTRDLERRGGRSTLAAVLAHEYGHHLDLAMNRQLIAAPAVGPAWVPELRADAWAGCALAGLQLPLEPLVAWMRDEQLTSVIGERAGHDHRTSSHPPWNLRISAVLGGHARCGGATAPPARLLYEAALDRRAPPPRQALAPPPPPDYWKTAVVRRAASPPEARPRPPTIALAPLFPQGSASTRKLTPARR
jgi:hypothetical protein